MLFLCITSSQSRLITLKECNLVELLFFKISFYVAISPRDV